MMGAAGAASLGRGDEGAAGLPVVFLMGPTGTGKTDLAVELASRLPMDIISVDSAMVYRDLDIGTAKPSPVIQAQAPHRLIDIRDPAESYSAAEFREDARREIEASLAADRIPLLVGGTSLYFRALERGISVLPPADPEVRAALLAELATLGLAVLHQRLAAIDPEAARRIHPHDPQRTLRALEIHAVTGQSRTALFAAAPRIGLPHRLLKFALQPEDRVRLHRHVEQRFRGMLAAGLVAEVEGLLARGDLHAGLPSMRLVGYREVQQHLKGDLDHDGMVARAAIATRQLAKRQLTWLRSEPGVEWFACRGERLPAAILTRLFADPVIRAYDLC
jgi:tRNA dimethylallyltransferase